MRRLVLRAKALTLHNVSTKVQTGSDSSEGASIPPAPAFLTTHWSVVLAAGRSDSTRAQNALAHLCRTYWYPLYAYVRRRGHSPHDAEDLTQGFFADLLEREAFARADPTRGRFRSFLLGAMNHFLAKEWRKGQARKRGAGCTALTLDLSEAEKRFGLETSDHGSPDCAFDRRWALILLNQVLNRLDAEYAREGKSKLFMALKGTLTGPRESLPYSALAAGLGMTEGAVKTAVHRLRKRYRALLQDEIANTVSSPDEAEEEMRHLFQVLARA